MTLRLLALFAVLLLLAFIAVGYPVTTSPAALPPPGIVTMPSNMQLLGGLGR